MMMRQYPNDNHNGVQWGIQKSASSSSMMRYSYQLHVVHCTDFANATTPI